MRRQYIYIILPLILLMLIAGCQHEATRPKTAISGSTTTLPSPVTDGFMFPDYGDSIVLPPNIAPLNFAVNEPIRLRITCGDGTLLDKHYRRQVRFHAKAWRRFLHTASENQQPLRLEINTTDRHYAPLHWFVAEDSIDPYLVYRLVTPDDGTYNVLGIFQREISSFKTRTIMLNSEGNCMNCHTFRNGNADEMILHWRFPSEGSLLQTPNGPHKIALSPEAYRRGLRLIFTAYHPQGRYIAFCTNHLLGKGRYEAHYRIFDAIDSLAHIVLYDISQNRLFTSSVLWDDEAVFAHPAWSPNGNRLYFCRAPKEDSTFLAKKPTEKQRVERIRFDLVYVTFDPETGLVGDSVHTLLAATDYNGSFAFPRVNPADPNCLVVALGAFSSFPSQAHGNLGLVFLDTPRFEPADILNSPEAESFHSWSQNGRWLVYASKRQDGYFSLPYIAYFDGKQFSKPFLLPQKDGDHYRSLLKSFNLPELTVTPSKLSPKKAEKIRKGPVDIIDDSNLFSRPATGSGH